MKRLRVVPDTNVIVASRKSANVSSPNRELTDRWLAGEFLLQYSRDTSLEYAEKLAYLGIPPADIEDFFVALRRLGELIPIHHYHCRHYPVDADDIAFLLCALNGAASHLVTYDDDLISLRPHYDGQFSICGPVEFLRVLRVAAGGRE